MKIAMVSHYFESHRGGIEIVAGGLTRALAGLGHQIVWLASATSAPPSDTGDRTVIALPSINILEDRFGIPMPLPKPSSVARIFSQIRGADAVLVHDALYPTSVLAFIAARLWRKPFVIAAHVGTIPYRNRLLRLTIELANRLIARPLLAHADRVAFISAITAQYFATVPFRAPPAMIFNGVDTGIFRPSADPKAQVLVRDSFGLPQDRPVALFVGRFVEKKGLHILHRIARERPGIQWAFAGWGPLDPGRWGLPNVSVFQRLDPIDLARLYRASDVLVLPSVGEGYPLVIQEALACGLPVICGDATARADEAARPFLTPIATDRTDHDAVAADYCAAVDRIIAAEPGRPEAAGERSRFAGERYSWNACAAQYLALIGAASTRGDRTTQLTGSARSAPAVNSGGTAQVTPQNRSPSLPGEIA